MWKSCCNLTASASMDWFVFLGTLSTCKIRNIFTSSVSPCCPFDHVSAIYTLLDKGVPQKMSLFSLAPTSFPHTGLRIISQGQGPQTDKVETLTPILLLKIGKPMVTCKPLAFFRHSVHKVVYEISVPSLSLGLTCHTAV